MTFRGCQIGPCCACAQSIVCLACPSFSHEVGISMARRLPPLNGLKAFEAAARHESFTRAAEELCVTQGAVSHQVKALEAELGLKLFNRERQRLVITEAGRTYLVVVRDAFDRIGDGTERLLQRQRGGVLTVSTSPNFAAKWLVHRLGRFAEAHPEIDLRVSASPHHVDFAREDIDLAIRHGAGNAPGPVLSQASMAIDAAVDGQGVVLARTALAAWDLIGGRLVRPFDIAMPASYAYWIVCSKVAAKLPKIVAFSDWLLAEAAGDARQLSRLKSKSRSAARTSG